MFTIERLEAERTALQRRIKNQRKALAAQNRTIIVKNALLRRYQLEGYFHEKNGYRHAAQLADKYWFGKRIAAAIRKWI